MLHREVFQVSATIWCVRQPSYLTCSYGIRTEAGVVLIDAGMDSSGSDVQALLAAMGESMESVRSIMITHWHNDHSAGASATKKQTGCPVYFSRDEEPWLSRETATGGVRGWISKRIPEWGLGVLAIGLLGEAVPEAVDATDYLVDGQQIDEDFIVVSTPGHTAGHLSFFYRPERTLFAGDALASIDGNVRFMARPVTLDVPKARQSMEKCLALDIGTLCPGHRAPLTQGVEQACDRMRDYLASGGRWPFWG